MPNCGAINKSSVSKRWNKYTSFLSLMPATSRHRHSLVYYSANQAHNSPTKNKYNKSIKNLTHYIIEQCIYIVCIYLLCEITAQAPLQFYPCLYYAWYCCLLSKCYLTYKVNYPRSQNLLIFHVNYI